MKTKPIAALICTTLLFTACASDASDKPYSESTAESTEITASETTGETAAPMSEEITESLPISEEITDTAQITEPSETEPPEPYLPELLKTPIKSGEITTNFADAEILRQLSDLSEFFAEFDMAVYFEDLESGGYFHYNADTRYYYQSVTKAFYTNRLFQLLSAEELEQKLTLEEKQREFNGDVYYFPAGSEFTVEYLIEQAVTNSDVTAYNMLYDHFGITDFNKYAASLGSGLNLKWGRFSGGSAKDAAALLRDIWAHREDSSAPLLELMKNTTYNYLIPSGTGALEVAHKYGYGGDGLGFNDVGIVYASRPFMLVILSNLPNTVPEFELPFTITASSCCDIADLLYEYSQNSDKR